MSSISLSTQNEIKFLFDSLSKHDALTPQKSEVLHQINTLHYAGLIPSEEALLIKNNLAHPENILFSEGILSELIIKKVNQGKLAPELKMAVREYGLEKTIFLLYTCYLEQTNYQIKDTEAYIIQQRIWKNWKQSPHDLFKRVLEAEEIESKRYIKEWLSTLRVEKEALEPLLKPLTDTEFKEKFLAFLSALYKSKENGIAKFCLEEMIVLLQEKPEAGVYLTLSRTIKAFTFYQKHLQGIEKANPKCHQFSLCLAADAIKNAPYAKELATSYHKIYGQIKKNWEMKNPLTSKSIAIVEGNSLDEKSVSKTIQKLFKKIQRPFYQIPTTGNLKHLVQSLLKKAPEIVLGAISPKNQNTLIDACKMLHIPLNFIPPLSHPIAWEDIASDPYKHVRISFPVDINSDFSEVIENDKITQAGIPGSFENTLSKKELRKKWNFPPHSKIVLIDSPEGDSPWPSYLAKNYNKDMVIIVLTRAKNTAFIHSLKTKVSPETQTPLKIYSEATSLEKEELLTLSDLVISKEKKEDSSILFEAWNARTPVLLDNIPSSLFEKIASFFNWSQEPLEVELHEKLLNEENLGIMIRSKENFKLALEELLFEEPSISKPRSLESQLPFLLEELHSVSQKQKNPMSHFEPFTAP